MRQTRSRGEEEIIATARRCRQRTAAEIRDMLIADAEAFAAGTPQHDDMTVVALKIRESGCRGHTS